MPLTATGPIDAVGARDLQAVATFKANTGGHIVGLCLSGDGERAFTAGAGGDVCEWRLDTAELVTQRLDLQTRLTAMTVSPQERFILVAAADSPDVVVHDAATGTPVLTLRGHSGTVRAFAWSPDGQRLASADSNGGLLVWDAATYDRVDAPVTGIDDVRRVAYSPDGAQLVFGGGDRAVIRDLMTGDERVFPVDGVVNDIALSPDGRWLAVAVKGRYSSGDGIDVFDVASGAPVRPRIDARFVSAVAYTPDGSALTCAFTPLGQPQLAFWNADDGQLIASYTASVGAYLAFTADGQAVASGGHSWTSVWMRQPAQTGGFVAVPSRQGITPAMAARVQPLAVLHGHGAGVTCVAFSPDGALLASGGKDRAVVLWDVSDGTELARLTGHNAALGVHGLAFSPDGARLASRSHSETVIVWDVASGERVLRFRKPVSSLNPEQSLAYSVDGTRLVAGYELFDAQTGESLGMFGAHRGPTNQGAFSADGTLFALACGGDTGYGPPAENALKVYDAITRKELAEFKEHGDWVVQVGFDPAVRLLASLDYSGILNIHDWPDGQLIGRGNRITTFLFGAAGLLVVANSDQSLRLLDTATGGGDGLRLDGHTGRVHQLAFNRAGTLLASASEDRSIRLWGVPG